MSEIIKTLDRRMAKYSTKERMRPQSFSKQIKLDPIHRKPVPTLKLSPSLSLHEISNPEIPSAREFRHSLTDPLASSKIPFKRWRMFRRQLCRRSRESCQNLVYWKNTLKRGVARISQAFAINKSCTLIQKFWKSKQQIANSNALKQAVLTLQRAWTQFYTFKRRKDAVLCIEKAYRALRTRRRLARAIIKKKQKKFLEDLIRFLRAKAAITIQRYFKGFKARKEHRGSIERALKMKKHQKMLQEQAQRVKERKLKAMAIKVIENGYLNYLNKKKLRSLRPYLWSLPYECRLLFLKLKQVKRDADELKADIDDMVFKKQQELLKNPDS